MPRAPLPSEAAAEPSGQGVPCSLQAAQASHSSLEASAGPSHVPVGQHASHVRRPVPVDEIRPLESTDSPLIRSNGLQAETEFMQVPSVLEHTSQPFIEIEPPVVAPVVAQVLAEQVESIVAVSPAQPVHVHVVPSAVDVASV